MDSKTLKTRLKGAVVNLKAEKYTETVKICKEILDVVPDHSRALVFLGKAAEGLNDNQHALEAYKKAAETAAADDLLPWQGLCSFYEKHRPGKAEDLTYAYEKLISLSAGNAEKQQEVRVKLTLHLLSQTNHSDEVSAGARAIITELSHESPNLYKLKLALAKYSLNSSAPESKKLFREVCEEIVDVSSFPVEEMMLWEVFAARLYQTEKDLELVFKRCEGLLRFYPTLSSVCRILAEIYCITRLGDSMPVLDTHSLKGELLPPALFDLYKHLSGNYSLTETFPLSKLARSVVACASIALAKSSIMQKSYKAVGDYLEKAEVHIDDIVPCLFHCRAVYKSMTKDLKIQMSFKQQKYADVISFCQNESGSSHRDKHVISLIEAGHMSDAEKMLNGDQAEDKVFLGYVKMKTELYEEAHTLLMDAVTRSPKSVYGNLWLGRTCLHLPTRLKDSAKYLLTAAKLDVENEEAFLYLGLYYNKIGELQRGIKCIKKSYSLNPVDDRICTAYVDQLIAQDNTEQALEILTQTTMLSSSGSCKWAWFRLGSLKNREGNLTDAINCFQQALRADEGDSNCWECLADCYVRRGSYTAAIGAFEKACEMNPHSVYSRYQLALIQHKLGLLTEARDQFLAVLSTKVDYTPALKGLGDVHIAIARDALKQSIYGRAMTAIGQALHYLTRAAVTRPDLSCVWKSLGDTLTLCVQLPPNSVLSCPTLLTRSDSGDAESGSQTTDINRSTALAIGARCYAQCKHLRVDDSYVWHDLAVNYLYQSHVSTDSAQRKALLTTASQCALKAINLDQSVASHYNCLGAIYMQPDFSDSLAAQHYLISGVELDSNNVQGWTNLAALYLLQGDVNLAHEALKVAQSADPKYNECWTGQAIVAEMIGHVEAMDLYRHSTDLGNNMESATGYAHLVLTTLLDKSHDLEHFRYSIEKLQAVPVSCLTLGNVVARDSNAQSLNAYGLLLERQTLLNMSAKALEQCVKMAEHSQDNNVPVYRSNLARVLCSRGDFTACLQQLNMISHPTTGDLAVGALAKFKLGQFSESFQSYSELVELTEDDIMKSHVYAAMGMLAVKCGDNDIAKTAFFQCSQSPVPSIYGLAGLCAFALLSGDWELAVAALTELVKREKSAAFTGDDNVSKLQSTFSSYMSALQGDVNSAKNHLLKAIHKYPTDRQLHNQLLALGIECLPKYRDSILRLSKSVVSVQDLAGVASLASGRLKESLIRAQASVHMHPDRHSNWSLLLSSANAVQRLQPDGLSPQNITRLLTYCMEHRGYPEAKRELQTWLAETAIIQAVENTPQSFASVSVQLSDELAYSSLGDMLRAYHQGDVEALTSADPTLFNILLRLQLKNAGESFIETGSLRALLTSAHPALNILLAKSLLQELTSAEEKGDLTAEFYSLLEEDNSSSAMFLQAFYHWKVKANHRLAVNGFSKVLTQSEEKPKIQGSLAKGYISVLSGP